MQKLKYPNGILVEKGGWVYRVANDTLIPLSSWRAVESWQQPILVGEEDLLDGYTVSSAKLGFRPASVVESFTTGKKYFIEGTVKRLISNPDFWELGFNEWENLICSDDEINFHADGEPLV